MSEMNLSKYGTYKSRWYCLTFIFIFSLLLTYTLKATIYIYNDKGADPWCVEAIENTLKNVTPVTVSTITAAEIADGRWTQDSDLLILPGGAANPMVSLLGGACLSIMQEYAFQGGSLMGTCAGGYALSVFELFDMGGPIQTYEECLGLAPAVDIGPEYGPYVYNSESGARAPRISSDHFQSFYSYYNGGGAFMVSVSAAYSFYPPNKNVQQGDVAEVRVKYGNSDHLNIIATGFHPFVSPSDLDADNSYDAKLIPLIESTDTARMAYLKDLLTGMSVTLYK